MHYPKPNEDNEAIDVVDGELVSCLQVAALPWRMDAQGRMRLLLVTSRNSKHWMLPKGWPMAGKADYEAASIEAIEEAGAEGLMSTQSIGTYRYTKVLSDGTERPARAVVFPLRVDRLRKRWRERAQRDRRWFTPAKAAAVVFERDLARLLLSLPAGLDCPALSEEPESVAATTVAMP